MVSELGDEAAQGASLSVAHRSITSSDRTLVIPVRGNEVLLGRKKRHHAQAFGVGRWNGFGGKLEPGETIEQAAVRECQEESGVTPTTIIKVAELDFVDDYDIYGHVFLATAWEGEPHDTTEMEPRWFPKTDLPYAQMWDDDIFWLPAVLAGRKVKARFRFRNSDDTLGTDYNPVETAKIEVVAGF